MRFYNLQTKNNNINLSNELDKKRIPEHKIDLILVGY